MPNAWKRTLRDSIFFCYPSWLLRILYPRYDFAFVGHPLVLEDLARQYPNLTHASKNTLKKISKNLWPVLGSEITGFRDNQGREVKGIVLFCPMSTRLLVLERKLAIKKLISIVKMAERLKVKIVGLGAFVPIVTHDGKILAKHTHLNMTTGTSFSAVIAVTNALKLAAECNLPDNSVVAIIGAAGSVGSICTRLLLDKYEKIVLIDKNKEALDRLLKSDYLKGLTKKTILIGEDISEIRAADLIIVTTNSPGTVVRSNHLKKGALVVDAAQPRNVSAKVPFERNDVIIVESGVAEVPDLSTNFQFDLKSYSEVYSCLAEVLILLWNQIPGKHVGVFDMSYVYMLRDSAKKIGINIPAFRNRAGYVTREEICRLREIIAERVQSEYDEHNSTSSTTLKLLL